MSERPGRGWLADQVLGALRDFDGPATIDQIVAAVGLPNEYHGDVYETLRAMSHVGLAVWHPQQREDRTYWTVAVEQAPDRLETLWHDGT